MEDEAGRDLAELLQHVLHVRGVEGVADRQPLGLRAALAPQGDELLDGVLVAGDDRGAGAVDPGDRDALAVAVGVQGGEDVVLGRLDRRHRAAGAGGLHEPAALGDEVAGVGQAQHAGQVGGGDLADRVAEEVVGAQAPVLGQAEQRGLHGEQRRLGEDGHVQQGRVR